MPPLQTSKRKAILIVFGIALLLAFIGFVTLGIWQLQRLAWKEDLIERVEARIVAPPAAAPAEPEWQNITREQDEYRRVMLRGRFLTGKETRVQAVTEIGAGFWILTPLQQRDGSIVLVNRGYAPSDWSEQPPQQDLEIVGLLRMTEPEGAFLRKNDAANQRWFSRDVAQIAAARELEDVAPYFVDLETYIGPDSEVDLEPPGWPRAGLTIVKFRNNHLSYALTWFGLALLTVWAGWQLSTLERKRRRKLTSTPCSE